MKELKNDKNFSLIEQYHTKENVEEEREREIDKILHQTPYEGQQIILSDDLNDNSDDQESKIDFLKEKHIINLSMNQKKHQLKPSDNTSIQIQSLNNTKSPPYVENALFQDTPRQPDLKHAPQINLGIDNQNLSYTSGIQKIFEISGYKVSKISQSLLKSEFFLSRKRQEVEKALKQIFGTNVSTKIITMIFLEVAKNVPSLDLKITRQMQRCTDEFYEKLYPYLKDFLSNITKDHIRRVREMNQS